MAELTQLTTLPPALAPWADELQAFPAELALSLQAPIQRLSAAVGPLSDEQVEGDGEPDGFDGLTRRGPYDRLLLSEWALAQAMPVEFLRRAVEGEQAFTRLRQVSPARSRRCVVLCDGGPSQLGEPRIAQLAALIVLARRARQAKVDFAWGLLPDATLHERLDRDAITAFRHGGRHRPGQVADLERWRAELNASAQDDLWLLGGPELLELGAPSTLVIEEVVEPGVRRLELAIHRLGVRRLTLELPPPDDCVRLFRAPLLYLKPAGPERAPGPLGEGRMWFSLDGNRLLCVRPGGVTAVHVPNSPTAAQKTHRGYDKRWEHPHVVAAGFYKKRVVGVALQDGALVTHQGRACAQLEGFVMPEAPVPCLVFEGAIALVDGAGVLWRVDKAEPLRRGVVAFDAKQLIHQDDQGTFLGGWYGPGKLLCRHRGGATLRGQPCVQISARQWEVPDHHGPIQLTAPEGIEVLGAMGDPDKKWSQRLVCLSADRRTLSLDDGDEHEVIAHDTRPIVAACLSPTKPQVAWRAEGGRLVVLDLHGRVRVLDLESP